MRKEELGELLRNLRQSSRLTRQETAQAAQVHFSTLGAWERGDRLGSVVAFFRVVEVLGYDVRLRRNEHPDR